MTERNSQLPPRQSCQDIKVRRANGADSQAIAAVGRRAFSAAFSHLFPAGVLKRYLEAEYSTGALRRSLAMEGHHYWVAEHEGVSGFIKLKGIYPHRQLRHSRPWQIEKLYVDAGESGRGCGTRLLATGEAFLRDNECDCAWLLVYEENHRAIGFYRRLGYTEGGRDYIDVEDVRVPFKLLLKAPVVTSDGIGASGAKRND
jgi:ribosomal protein S18 acetylase RimI-like enzyme